MSILISGMIKMGNDFYSLLIMVGVYFILQWYAKDWWRSVKEEISLRKMAKCLRNMDIHEAELLLEEYPPEEYLTPYQNRRLFKLL